MGGLLGGGGGGGGAKGMLAIQITKKQQTYQIIMSHSSSLG